MSLNYGFESVRNTLDIKFGGLLAIGSDLAMWRWHPVCAVQSCWSRVQESYALQLWKAKRTRYFYGRFSIYRLSDKSFPLLSNQSILLTHTHTDTHIIVLKNWLQLGM